MPTVTQRLFELFDRVQPAAKGEAIRAAVSNGLNANSANKVFPRWRALRSQGVQGCPAGSADLRVKVLRITGSVQAATVHGRREGMTAEQALRRTEISARHYANRSPEQVERTRARKRLEGMSPEQVARERARKTADTYIAKRNALNQHYSTLGRYLPANLPPDRAAATRARRKRATLTRANSLAQARPPWADDAAIAAVYAEAALLTITTGVKWHVDHIVPVRGGMYIDGRWVRLVSGLHVQGNLEPLLGTDNVRKQARVNLDELSAAQHAYTLACIGPKSSRSNRNQLGTMPPATNHERHP